MKYNRKGNKQIKGKQKTKQNRKGKKRSRPSPPTGPVAHLHRTPPAQTGPHPRTPDPGPAHLSSLAPFPVPPTGSEQGRALPPDHLAGTDAGEDKGASGPRPLGPLSHSPRSLPRPLRLSPGSAPLPSSPPPTRSPPFPSFTRPPSPVLLPDVSPSSAASSPSSPTTCSSRDPLHHPPTPSPSSSGRRRLLRLRRLLLLLSLSPASVCRAVSFSPSSPVLSLSRAP